MWYFKQGTNKKMMEKMGGNGPNFSIFPHSSDTLSLFFPRKCSPHCSLMQKMLSKLHNGKTGKM